MRTRSKTIVLVSILILAATAAVTGSGASGSVWGIARDEFLARLASGDHEFLRRLEISSVGRDVSDAKPLGPEALLMLGYAYADLGMPGHAKPLFSEATRSSPDPWRYHAVVELLGVLDSERRYAELEDVSSRFLRVYPDDTVITHFHIGSLYRQARDAEVLAELAATAEPAGSMSAERALWRAVSSSRLGNQGWQANYRALFLDHPAGDVHSRMWVYLLNNRDVYAEFADPEIAYFDAKRLLGEGKVVQAADQLSVLAESGNNGLFGTRAALRDFYLAGSLSGRQTRTASQLIRVSQSHSDGLTPLALEYAGRLLRTAGNYNAAIDVLGTAADLYETPDDTRRTTWYLLSSQVRLNPVRAADDLHRIVLRLDEPGYYDDVFSELATLLVQLRAWESLLKAYESIRDFATPATLGLYELILAEAILARHIAVHPDRRDGVREEYLRRAASQSMDLYAALVAASFLGDSGINALRAAALANNPVAVNEEHTLRVRSLTRFGLFSRASAVARANPGAIEASSLIDLMDGLFSAGMIRESIRVAIRTPITDLNTEIGWSVLLRRFPKGYEAVVDEVLAEESLDEWLLYAMVRSESLFEADVVSSAGAVGLTQLLPSTAADIARRMRIETPDLTDPFGNLRVGARYLTMLTEQFGSPILAVMAYNAGQGRVRDWERLNRDLDTLLFHIATPFDETRNHIRNVVVSASYYGYLYGDQSPTETVSMIFGTRESKRTP